MSQTTEKTRGRPRTLVGTVISAKAKRTVAVSVVRLVKHTRYGKYVRRTTRLHVHDPQDSVRVGDRVQIVQTRPLSKTKSWRVLKLIDRPEAAEEAE